MQPGQFTSVSNGAIYKVEISDYLIDNVVHAYINYLNGQTNEGALFFTTGTFSGLTYLFTDEVNHSFFK